MSAKAKLSQAKLVAKPSKAKLSQAKPAKAVAPRAKSDDKVDIDSLRDDVGKTLKSGDDEALVKACISFVYNYKRIKAENAHKSIESQFKGDVKYLVVENYSDKAFALFCKEKPNETMLDRIRELKGKYNRALLFGPGHIFSNKHLKEVKTYFESKKAGKWKAVKASDLKGKSGADEEEEEEEE